MIGLPQVTTPSQVCEDCVVSNNSGIHSRKKSLGEQRNHWSWCILTFVLLLIHLQIEVKDTFKSFKMLVEKEIGSPIKSLRIMVENMSHKNLKYSVRIIESGGNLLQLALNKMEFVRGKIALF